MAREGGITGSDSTQGGPDPRETILLDDQLPDLGVKIANLAFMIPDPHFGGLRGHLSQTLDAPTWIR